MVKIMETPIKMDDLGVPFTIIFGNTHTLLGFVGKMTNIFPLSGGEFNGDDSHEIESVKNHRFF